MSQIDLPSLALILGALARGTTHIDGVTGLAGLAAALTALGAGVEAGGGDIWEMRGTGVGGWREPARVLDPAGRPGALPLLAGLLATHAFTALLAGDSDAGELSLAGLRGPLERVGAHFALRRGDRLPGAITGTPWPLPALHEGLDATTSMALLLAGLNSPGRTGVTMQAGLAPGIELLRRFGAGVELADGQAWIVGYPDLTGTDVPAAALITA